MKRLFLIMMVVTAAACSRPRQIPDSKMEDIFKDIFLVNAYSNLHPINTDTLNIYEPILEKYGYKPRDLVYTLEQFSRRKSSRLSDILNASINKLAAESEFYAARVAVLDSIERIARDRFREVAYTDTLIKVTSLRDTARLRIHIPAQEGQYRIGYAYTIDTLDKNTSLRTTHTLTDSAGRHVMSRTNWMTRGKRSRYEVTLDATPSTRRLEIVFGNYTPKSTRPWIRIDTLSVIYYPPVQAAIDSLTRELMDFRLIIDGKEYDQWFSPDSVALRIDPPRVAAPRDTLP